jgi:hypothetical protein
MLILDCARNRKIKFKPGSFIQANRVLHGVLFGVSTGFEVIRSCLQKTPVYHTQLSDERAKVFVTQGQGGCDPCTLRGTGRGGQVGKRKQSKRFQRAQAVTDRVGTFPLRDIGTGYKGHIQANHVLQRHEFA